MLCLLVSNAGCTALLDTASLQGGAGAMPSDASPADQVTSDRPVADAAGDLSSADQCPSDAGPFAACIARNCCPYISACRNNVACSMALGAYDACIASARTDSIKRMACAVAFRNAAPGVRASDVVNCENLYRDVCNDV
jgi:hypothetical protein